MAYSSGSLILDDDYNIFVTGNAAGTGNVSVPNLNSVWGVGAADKGYGQTSTLSAVSAGATITAIQWESLLSRVEAIAVHQGTTINSPTGSYATITAGQTITALANLSTDITNVYNNRGNAVASGTDITANGTTTTSSIWTISATLTQTVTFPSADQARYFFNAGGMIRLNWGLTSPGNPGSDEWQDLLSKSGTIVFTGGTATQTIAGTAYTGTTKIGGGGSTSVLTTTTGFHDLTTGGAAVEIFKQFADTAPYTANYISLSVALNAAGTQLIFTTALVDPKISVVPISGTLSQTMVVRPPSATYLTNTWGTPSMDSVTWVTSTGSYPTLINTALNTATGTTIAVTKPASTDEGDLMVAFVGTNNAGTEYTWTGPAGWTEFYDEAGGGGVLNGPDLACYYKTANAAEGASYTFTVSGSTSTKGIIATYRGAAVGQLYSGFTQATGLFSASRTLTVSTYVPNTTLVCGAAGTATGRQFTATDFGNVVQSSVTNLSMSVLDRQVANISNNSVTVTNTGGQTPCNAVFINLIPTA